MQDRVTGVSPRTTRERCSCHDSAVRRIRPALASSVALLVLSACVSGPPSGDKPDYRPPVAKPAPSEPDDPRIITPPSYIGSGYYLREAETGRTELATTVNTIGVCLDRRGTVTVDSIEPVMDAGEIRVDAFTLRLRDRDTDFDAPGALPVDGGRQVDRPCADGPRVPSDFALYMQVVKVSPETAMARHLLLRYTSNGHDYEYTMPFTLLMCVPGERKVYECRSQ